MEILNWSEVVAQRGLASTAEGNIQYIPDFYMPQLDSYRDIWIYLPPSYEWTSRKRYPVLYMQDGQNLFDNAIAYAGDWGVDKILLSMRRPEMIVVGIANNGENRMLEYDPAQTGEAYAECIAETIKPCIDATFRTRWQREYTGVAGSSMGGLISLYIGMRYNELFSRIGAFSPALLGDMSPLEMWEPSFPVRLYMDVGFREGLPYMDDYEYATNVWRLYFNLTRSGFPEDDLWFRTEPQAAHCEQAWSERFGPAMHWLFS